MDAKHIRFIKWINKRYPRNGEKEANDRAVFLLSLKICKEDAGAMKRLAAN